MVCRCDLRPATYDKHTDMVRCFVNVGIGKEQRKRISELVEELKKIPADVKYVDAENLHITPRFFGDIKEDELPDIEKGLEKAANETSSFELKLLGTGVFPNQNYVKVLWIGAEKCPELQKLKKLVDGYIPVGEKDSRPFEPHVTIGRVRSRKNLDLILKKLDEYKDFDFGSEKITEINVKKSTLTPEGPVYENLARFELKI